MAELLNTTVTSELQVLGDMTVSGTVGVAGTDMETKFSLLNTLNSRLTKWVGTTYTLTTTYTNGTNWTISTATAYLIGNVLRVNFAATRSAAVSGNFDNEKIGTLTINSSNRVAQLLAVNFTNSSSGGMASMLTANVSVSDGVITIPININATAQSTTSTNAFITCPVRLNPSYY